MLYIPIWFYSNTGVNISSMICDNFTFQSGSIQMIMRENRLQLLLLFTFQSGYIQILTTYNIPTDQLNFTFQSGSIQIVWYNCTYMISKLLYIPIWLYSNLGSAPSVSDAHKSLHSNLVIFKWSLSDRNKLEFNVFTFQSGYIQIVNKIVRK